MKKMKLAAEKYIDVIEHTQLVSIDLLVTNGDRSKILLGKRVNQPARDTWFVPGSRLYKAETIQEGLSRVSKDELGVELTDGKLIGVFDHIYDSNFLERQGISTHYVALGMLLIVNEQTIEKINANMPLDQHANIMWFDVSDETMTRKDVHLFTKTYLSLLRREQVHQISFGDARNFLQ
jgi:colanic acid biosynthesis protein WcaH